MATYKLVSILSNRIYSFHVEMSELLLRKQLGHENRMLVSNITMEIKNHWEVRSIITRSLCKIHKNLSHISVASIYKTTIDNLSQMNATIFLKNGVRYNTNKEFRFINFKE